MIALVLAGCGCTGNGATVERMRAIPKERLAGLYEYVQAMDAKRQDSDAIVIDFSRHPVPKELLDIAPKSLNVDGDQTRMHLSGCVDDKIYLFFEGLESKGSERRIVLSLGEGKGAETIWQY